MNTLCVSLDPFTDTADSAHLEKAIEAVPHVRSVEIDPQAQRATVVHEGADPREITAALRELGYHATVVA